MQLTPANLDALYYVFLFGFQQVLMKAKTYWEGACSQYPSIGRENRYAWIDRLPKMREWVGERQYKSLKGRVYLLKNRDWELSDELDRNDVQDDTYSLFASQNIPMMAMEVARNPDVLFLDVLQNGDSSSSPIYQAFDGQPFFNGSHPVDMDDSSVGTYSNLFTTTALTSTNFGTTRATMRAYLGADGLPIGVEPRLAIIPPALEVAARQILNATFTAPANAVGQNAASVMQGNVLMGMADMLVFDLLAGQDTTWYLADVSMPVRPWIRQLRQAPVFVFRNKVTDSNYFERKKLQYGADTREAFGYSLPFLAAKCTA